MEFKTIDTLEAAQSVYPILNELRTDLTQETYLARLEAARHESGYRLIGAFEAGECRGLMGYRILTDFVHGRHLYVDDLVVRGSDRSKGVGSKLLAHAKDIAAKESCPRLRLCTGVDNESGRRFYEKNQWQLRAVVFKTSIN